MSSTRRYLGLVLQKPPTPLTVARHCANVSKPQLLEPPRMLYCAHHGYSRAWPNPTPSSSVRTAATPYVARIGHPPRSPNRRWAAGPPGARNVTMTAWAAHITIGARIGTQGACQCARRHGAQLENARF